MTFWDRFWKDKHGHWAIWQTPNAPLIIWFVAMIGAHVTKLGAQAQIVLGFVSFVSLLVWAILEVKSGASYFRRMLGLVVLIYIVVALTIGILFALSMSNFN